MSLTDVLMIAATALSPLIAVQVTRFLDDRKEERGRRLQVFRILMATRAYGLSPAHVEALNRIELEFSGSRKMDKEVIAAWQQYLDHLTSKALQGQAWGDKKTDLLVDMLYVMGKAVGYDFSKTQIKNATYAPAAHGRFEYEQERLRQLALELLEGKRSLPTIINPLPQQQPPTSGA